MKQTTNKIYNLITNSNFENVKQKLIEQVERHRWQIPERQEYSYEELLEDLPNCIDILKQNIEDASFDSLPYNNRNQIFQTINQIHTTLTNIYSNHQQFAQLQDYTQTLKAQIRANRLDFEAKRIPRYKEKIKEYKELIAELIEVNNALNTTKTKHEELEVVLNRAKEIVSEIDTYSENAKKFEIDIKTRLDNSTETYNKINALLATIHENRDNILEMLKEAKDSKNNVQEIESEIQSFFEQIDEYKVKIEDFLNETKEKVAIFETDTQNIIEKNQEQQQEIKKQLEKAVGVSLFSTFAKRKEQLSPAIWGWLGIIILSVIGMAILSYDIINEFTNSVNHMESIKNTAKIIMDKNSSSALSDNLENLNTHISWMWVFLKMTLLLPLIYLISFATSRYGKERRLIEEYAFKSTISLALTPYADLIKKIEAEGADSKYRDFLIASIENIFSVPTDKAFGYNKYSQSKEDKNQMKIITDVMNVIDKAKNIGNTD